MAWSPIFLSLLLFLPCVASASTSSSSDSYIAYGPEELQSEERILHLFDAWMVRQGKTYGSPSEKATRLKVFKENLIYIDRHNRGGEYSYWLGLNRFADLTNQEFRLLYLGFNLNSSGSPKKKSGGGSFMYAGVEDVPPSLDWRLKGAVTNIKDQGTCASSWAFSSVAAVEGINQIKTKRLLSLSEQELIDCDKHHNQKGCKGGRMDDAFGFIISNGGISTDQDYSYKARDNQCDKARLNLEAPHSTRNAHIVTIATYENVPTNDEVSLLKAVANQPISVAIDASHKDFQLYAGGVFNGKCNNEVDHSVTIVGYNTDKSWKAYWIVKNSWGKSWGEKGYIRMARGMGGSEGLCGINLMASYPVMKGPNLPNPVSVPAPPTPLLAQSISICGHGFTCPNSTTCCCTFLWQDTCHGWGCCPKESATDCKDPLNRCPRDYPANNLASNVCGNLVKSQFNLTLVSSIFIKALLKAFFKAITKGLVSRW